MYWTLTQHCCKGNPPNLSKQNLILEFTWLQKHNPEINWQTQRIMMSWCPNKCHTCWVKICDKQKTIQKEERQIRACRAKPLLRFTDDDLELNEEGMVWEVIHEAELLNSEDIRASQMTSQRLVEESHKWAPTETEVPKHLQDFGDVFAKESFDELPNQKVWNHAIELEPGSEPSNCKVYPLSPNEQTKLNAFLQENLHSGHIHPSKLLMASPVFFIKKKEGALWLVQDYWALNTMTIKNHYPIPLIPKLINQLYRAKYFTKLDVHWGIMFAFVRVMSGTVPFWPTEGCSNLW